MKFEDVMIDLETLGRRPGCAILSIGAVAFSVEHGLGPELEVVVSRESCKHYDLHEDPETLDWWSKQTKEARETLVMANDPSSSDLLPSALIQLEEYLAKFDLTRVRVWGNGSDFDNAILAVAYAAIDRPLPWQFYNNRCYRTLKSLRQQVKMQRMGMHHNALADAKSQALHAIELLRATA